MNFSWNINVGNLLIMAGMVVAVVGFYWRLIYDSKDFQESISEIKVDLKTLNKVIIDLALQNQRLDNQAERINRLDHRLDELRHGKGLVI